MTELIVEQKSLELAEVTLESGDVFGPIKLVYETYGQLNSEKSNVILIFHALSGDAHVAGKHSPNDKKSGWWDIVVGPGKVFDTNKYFVICINTIGGCGGSTGPSSINPKNEKPYGLNFPLITIKDMVNVQFKLLDQLGINSVLAVVGGSMGGMMALQASISFPDKVENVIAVATSAQTSAQNIAFNEVGRRAIIHDPNWKNGSYYDGDSPNNGLAIARMVGHITYLSDESMKTKFGRRVKNIKEKLAKFEDPQFEVESYLQYKGLTFTERFDANTYLYITKAIDLFNLEEEGDGSLKQAFSKSKSRFLIIHFTSDWLFPEHHALEVVDALKDNNLNVSYRVIDSSYGHDAFLIESSEMHGAMSSFLAGAS